MVTPREQNFHGAARRERQYYEIRGRKDLTELSPCRSRSAKAFHAGAHDTDDASVTVLARFDATAILSA